MPVTLSFLGPAFRIDVSFALVRASPWSCD